MKGRIVCLSSILIVFLFGIIISFNESIKPNEVLISIEVKGAVVNQGVYFCRYGISVAEVLELCGGMTELGYLPDNFDYNTLITNDTVINIQKRYLNIRKRYEELR